MLDSQCMMLDDQDMTEEWIVRVQGKEYGPADIDTLREWKSEGRLLPENEARNKGADLWSTAAAIPGLFDVGALAAASAPQPTQPPLQTQHRSFGQILAETFQIYRKGFFQFLGLTLLVLLPSVCSQLTTALMQTARGSDGDLRVLAGGSFAFLMFVLSMVMWPVYVAGSGRALPWFERPLWRGAFIASLWFAFVLAITLVPQWTTLHHYFNQLATTQDPQTLLQQLTEAQQAQGFDISSFALVILRK